MKKILELTLLFILIMSCSHKGVRPFSPMDLKIGLHFKGEYNKDQLITMNEGQSELFLDLAEEIDSISILSQGEYRVLLQTHTSVTVMDEGPHIDLIDWKHGESSFSKLQKKDEAFKFVDNSKEASFPVVSTQEIVLALTKEVDQHKLNKRWIDVAKNCRDAYSYPCAVAPSLYLFHIEKRVNGQWELVGKLRVIVPMGC